MFCFIPVCYSEAAEPFSETADEARGSGDPSESRFEAILRQSRPLSSFPDFGNIIIRLLGSKEESDVANSIAKMTRKRSPGYFHLYARWNQPQHFSHFQKNCTSF